MSNQTSIRIHMPNLHLIWILLFKLPYLIDPLRFTTKKCCNLFSSNMINSCFSNITRHVLHLYITIVSGSSAASLYCKLLNEHHIVTKEIFNTKPSALLKGIRNG